MPRTEGAVRRRWIPVVVVVACLVGVAAVYRLHGLFGGNSPALVGGARSEKIIEINPKNVPIKYVGRATIFAGCRIPLPLCAGFRADDVDSPLAGGCTLNP